MIAVSLMNLKPLYLLVNSAAELKQQADPNVADDEDSIVLIDDDQVRFSLKILMVDLPPENV